MRRIPQWMGPLPCRDRKIPISASTHSPLQNLHLCEWAFNETVFTIGFLLVLLLHVTAAQNVAEAAADERDPRKVTDDHTGQVVVDLHDYNAQILEELKNPKISPGTNAIKLILEWTPSWKTPNILMQDLRYRNYASKWSNFARFWKCQAFIFSVFKK